MKYRSFLAFLSLKVFSVIKKMARKIYDPNDEDSVDPQLQNQSRELYANFLREEIQIHGLSVPSEINL